MGVISDTAIGSMPITAMKCARLTANHQVVDSSAVVPKAIWPLVCTTLLRHAALALSDWWNPTSASRPHYLPHLVLLLEHLKGASTGTSISASNTVLKVRQMPLAED